MADGKQAGILWSDLFGRVRGSGGELSLEVGDDWMQGRSVFGGLQAAFALRAMRGVAPAVPLRTLQATFLAPVPAGTMKATARVLRTGKNTTHVEARLVDGDTTLMLAVGVFGASRASAVAAMPRQIPVANDKPIEVPFVPGVIPAFVQNFRPRWLAGRPPYTGDTALEQVIAVDMRDRGPVSEGHVLAIADYPPPVALSHLRKFAAGSTLTWMLELLADHFDGLSLEGWRIDAQMVAARDGYTSQSVTVWGPGGVPVALSRQNMVVFG